MSSFRAALACLLAILTLLPAAHERAFAQEQDQRPAQLWADFNHYVIISRPDMAAAAGQALLDNVDNPTLLEVVEAGDYQNYQNNLARAQRIDELAEVAEALEQRIQEARIEQARDEERIRRNIDRLNDGQRPFHNAVERLAGAGQFAVPHMLAALQNERQDELHPWIIEALATMGRPAVYPLATAVPGLDPVTQSQVAQVLGRIGEPMTLPYLKEVLERDDVEDHARQALQQSFDRILQNAPRAEDRSAAELYLDLAAMRYRAASDGRELPGYDAAQDRGIVWEYHDEIGLVAVPVPAAIHGDVLAMRASRRALQLDPEFDAALSQYLMANLRRQNNLPEGETDPSYDQDMLEPAFYTMLAGPARQHDVLAQALTDQDVTLALDAITALTHTAGTDALINLNASSQPLLDALSYPDRRVRFGAAQALAKAHPTAEFPEAHRVVPVLAEAVRQKDVQYALVLADDQETLNRRLADVRELGYEALGGQSLADSAIRTELATRPGIDLILIDQSFEGALDTFQQTQQDYKLSLTPVVAIAAPADQYRLEAEIGDNPRFNVTTPPAEAEQQEAAPADGSEDADTSSALRNAIEQATRAYAGEALTGEQSTEVALAALQSLRDIALAESVYRIGDAEAALIRALEDERAEVARRAANVLALVESGEAQRALAERAFAETGELQIVMLEALGDSATHHGNLLAQRQSEQLRDMVQASTGEQSIAAARAHGALSLPTSNAVQMILSGDRDD